jgi:hypothetical protein
MKSDFDYENDEPPARPEAKGHPPARRALINYIAVKRGLEDKLGAEKERKHKLQRMIDEPAETEKTLAQTLKSESLRLLESIGFVSEGTHAEQENIARESIEAKLAANRRSADTARHAMPEVETRIALHELQLQQSNRKRDYLLPALIEAAEKYGPVYIKRARALADVMEPLFSLGELVHGWDKIERKIVVPEEHDNWSRKEVSVPEIRLPRAKIDTLKLVPDSQFVIKLPKENPWRAVVEQLIDDPTAAVKMPSLGGV